MASSVSIRAGRAHVEVSTDDRGLAAGLARAQKRLARFGGVVDRIGRGMVRLGLMTAAPIAALGTLGASFEQAMAMLQAAANPTEAELRAIEAAIMRVSDELRVMPGDAAITLTELLKAGMPLPKALRELAGAMRFTRTAEMDVAAATVVLTDALNVFGHEGHTAASVGDILSRAADASSTTIAEVAAAFSQASAVAGLAGLSLQDLATSIAILANNGVKGSDAGTSIKTMLTKLMAPTDDARGAMAELGLNVRDVRGQMLPLPQILANLEASMAGLNDAARDDALFRIFGSDALRAAAILGRTGAKGWEEFTTGMAGSLTVAQKYALLMDTFIGRVQGLRAAVARLGIAIWAAIGDTLSKGLDVLIRAVNWLTAFATAHRNLILWLLAGVSGVAALGAALVAFGVAIKAGTVLLAVMAVAVKALTVPFVLLKVAGVAAIKALVALLAAMISPMGSVVTAAAAMGSAWAVASGTVGEALGWLMDRLRDLWRVASETTAGIADALAADDMRAAADVLWAGLKVAWQTGVYALRLVWIEFKTAFHKLTSELAYGAIDLISEAWARLRTIWVETTAFLKTAWIDITSSILSAWNTVQEKLEAGFLHLMGMFDDTLDVEAAIEMSAKQRGADQARADAEAAKHRQTVDEDRKKSLKEIDQDRENQKTMIAQNAHDDQTRLESERTEALEASGEDLAAAQAKLFMARVKAAAARIARGLAMTTESLDREEQEKAKAREEQASQGAGSAAGVDVRGTFNAAALQGLQGARGVDLIVTNTKKTADGVKDLNRTVREQGGPVFA